ncbi:hypothetical protein L226DRAFT_288345 [Lentinus tigrinus ALCF2SS1-7]|uniref:uncharacterized protein n=1 Tax=Lentinus tigrinus ALCF2SS1-7 TaxID=1328758 RepID=UPI0011661DBD|nr:hypothetical protein L226DRAFT_288345 [Lentinus tigrinus ALCF2SS1-7]
MLEHQTKVALEQSLTSGIFIDAQFYLFSRRSRDGSVYAPLPIYAHSTSLTQAASYFKPLFGGGFVEDIGKATSLDSSDSSIRTPLASDEFGYDSDSDLDDEEIMSPSGEDDRASASDGRTDDAPEPVEASNLKNSPPKAGVADGTASSNQEVAAESSVSPRNFPYSSSYGDPLKRIPVRYSVTARLHLLLCVRFGKLPRSRHARRFLAPQNLCTVLPISTISRH